MPLDLEAGDTILFGKYSGSEIKLEGTEYLIMKESDVLASLDAADVAALPPSTEGKGR